MALFYFSELGGLGCFNELVGLGVLVDYGVCVFKWSGWFRALQWTKWFGKFKLTQ